MGVSYFSGVYILFASSHTPYLEVGEKIPGVPQKILDQLLGECISFLRLHIQHNLKLAKRYQICQKMGYPIFTVIGKQS